MRQAPSCRLLLLGWLVCCVCGPDVSFGQLNVAIAPFAIQKNAVDPDDLTLELATPRILKNIRILSSNAVLSSGSTVADLSKIQWNEGEPDVFLLSGVIGKDSAGLLSARGLLASQTSPQIASIRASGKEIDNLVDDMFAKIDQAFSQAVVTVISGKWEDPKTKSQYLISHWDSKVAVRLLDAPVRPGNGDWSFARGTISLVKGVPSVSLKCMHHDFKFTRGNVPATIAEKVGAIEATGRRVVFDGEEWRRMNDRHPKLMDKDLEKASEFIEEVLNEAAPALKIPEPNFQSFVRLGRKVAFLEQHLGFVWSGFDVDQVQKRIGELQYQLEEMTLGKVPGADLHAGIPLIGAWTRPEASDQNLYRMNIGFGSDPNELLFELERIGAEWPDMRNLRRGYTEKRSLPKESATGKYRPFSALSEKSLRIDAFGVRPAGATDGFRSLPVADLKDLELLKQLSSEQILASANETPKRADLRDVWRGFEVTKPNLDRPQIGQQIISVRYDSAYQTTASFDGRMLEVRMPHQASGTLVRSETILGKWLQPGELKDDPWKKSLLSR